GEAPGLTIGLQPTVLLGEGIHQLQRRRRSRPVRQQGAADAVQVGLSEADLAQQPALLDRRSTDDLGLAGRAVFRRRRAALLELSGRQLASAVAATHAAAPLADSESAAL